MTVEPAGTDAASITEALRQNAGRLGLKWRRIPGTVTEVNGPGEIQVRLDGDSDQTLPVKALSLVGGLVAGERVMCDFVPPQGVYVIGRYGTTAGLINCEIQSAANIPVLNATATPVTWATMAYDTGGFFQGASSGAITLPFTGMYDMDLYSDWQTGVPAANGIVGILNVIVGSIGQLSELKAVATGGHSTTGTLSDQLPAQAGDPLQVQVYQVTGVTRTVNLRMRLKYAGAGGPA